MATADLKYLSVEDVLTLHDTVVEADDRTEPDISSRGDIDYAVSTIREGHFGAGPETIHEKAAELLRLLTVNHPFVDGNKRTALVSTVAFYALNGYDLEYADEIRSFLKRLATDQSTVADEESIGYLKDHTTDLPEERETRYHAFLNVAATDEDQRNDYTEDEEI